jgi:hypothetical protein
VQIRGGDYISDISTAWWGSNAQRY